MTVDVSSFRKRVLVAGKKEKADLVIRNGKIVNVFTGEIMYGDIAVVDGIIAGIGIYQGKEIIDAGGKYIIPGFIDGHVHIESSMLTPAEFAKVLLMHGVTTAITDPHEIANVAGTEGIKYMLETSEDLPLTVHVMLPSCVPATPLDHNGATLEAEDLVPFMDHPRVLGLAEVMDFPSVYNGKEEMLKKLVSIQNHNGLIDGHAAGIDRESLNVYMASGIRNDHEATNKEEAKNRLDLGMYLMIREGTVAKDLEALLPVVTERNARRCIFVTDDKLIDDLYEEGSVDHCVRLAIEKGLDPITSIQMATINTAECFGMKDKGAIAPGYQADFILLEDLDTIKVDQVYVKGKCVVQQGELVEDFPTKKISNVSLPSIQTAEIQLEDFALPIKSSFCNVIEIIPNSIVTKHRKEIVDQKDGNFTPSITKDQLKLVVIERHRATGNIGKGIVKGFGITKGAIATTISHDSHNIVAVGVRDEDIFLAVEELKKINGGIVVVSDRKVIYSLPLPIAGLISEESFLTLYKQLQDLNGASKELGGYQHFNPFLTLSFLSLSVIPTIKLTDEGLFDFDTFSYIPIEAE